MERMMRINKLTLNTLIILLLFIVTERPGVGSELTGIKNPHISNLIQAAEIRYDLPPGLLAAIVDVESAGNHKARNGDDGTSAQKASGKKIPSYGLLQIQLPTARFIQSHIKGSDKKIPKRQQITATQLLDPEINVDYGAAYLKWNLNKRHNNIASALTCINVGHNSKLCTTGKFYGPYVGKVLNMMLKHQAE